jgi:rubredoxin
MCNVPSRILAFYVKAIYAGVLSMTWMCLICGWIYDEALGAPDDGIAAGTPWEKVPMNWTCPECGARKEDFEMVQI